MITPRHLSSGFTPLEAGRRSSTARLLTGFTVVEVLVAFSITAVALLLFDQVLLDGYRFMATLMSKNASQSQVITVERTITNELRTLSPSTRGEFPIFIASPNELAFFSRADKSTLILYQKNGTVLTRSAIPSTGTPPVYRPLQEPTTILTGLSSSSPLFFYFNADNNALEQSIDRSRIRRIEILFDASRAASTVALQPFLLY